MQNHTFGQNMKRLRKEKRIIQQQLADMLNTSRSCISNYETDTRQPDWETMIKIARCLGTSVDYLLGISSIKAPVDNQKEIKDINQLQEIAKKLGDSAVLDMRDAPVSVKCRVAEFYTYLVQREAK